MKCLFKISLALLLTSCVSTKVVKGPDGSEHHLITCGDVELCYSKATEICGKYKIIDSSTNTSEMNGTTSTFIKVLVKCQ